MFISVVWGFGRTGNRPGEQTRLPGARGKCLPPRRDVVAMADKVAFERQVTDSERRCLEVESAYPRNNVQGIAGVVPPEPFLN